MEDYEMVRATLARLKTALTTGTAASLMDAFRDQQRSALRTWRDAVKAHAEGKPVDITVLAVTGPQIGVRQDDVPRAFAADVEAYRESVELEAHAKRMDAAADESEKLAVGAASDIERLNQELAQAIHRRDAGVWNRVAAAHARTPLNVLRRKHPRLFDDGRDVDPEAHARGLSLEVTPLESSTTGVFDNDNTAWLPDEE